jgi:hypothetical protein
LNRASGRKKKDRKEAIWPFSLFAVILQNQRRINGRKIGIKERKKRWRKSLVKDIQNWILIKNNLKFAHTLILVF